MIPLTILYDEYIGRPKLTEQKKNPVYIVPPSPQKWGSEQTFASRMTNSAAILSFAAQTLNI